MLRLSAGGNVALTILCVVLGNAISTMLPLKTTEIALVRVNSNDDKVYRIEPLTQRTDGFDLVVESAAKQYVRDLRSEEHTSELQSLMRNSYAVFCLKKKKLNKTKKKHETY